jgi:hypothetical protein
LQTLKPRIPVRTSVLLALSLLVIGFVAVPQPSAFAKGVRNGTQDQASDQTQGSSRAQSDSSSQNQTPRNSTSNSRGPQSTNTAGQNRDQGTKDTSGQYLKRDERRDPEYRYRHHYEDRFYYPYDFEFYSSYPDYGRGSVIIISRDKWGDRPVQWRRTYEYQHPAPGSVEEALVDIEATWAESNAEFLMWHVDHTGDVDIYTGGKYSHTLAPREIYRLTDEAIQRTDTIYFGFTEVTSNANSAVAYAKHEYRGPDRTNRVAYPTYYLDRLRGRWVIDRIDIEQRPHSSTKCFIATAAFGSPMAKDVVVLRNFRDKYLLTNKPGRVFVSTYYQASPPVANWIAGHDYARAFVRVWLWPMIQLCKLVLR